MNSAVLNSAFMNMGVVNSTSYSPFASQEEDLGLVLRYSAKGKTNQDVDRDVLKDLSGNGHDLKLYNFGFTQDSGYQNLAYPDGLVFDGVDDYALCNNTPMLTDYTFIAKLKMISAPFFMFGKGTNNPGYDFSFTYINYSTYSFGASNDISNNKDLFWQTTNSFMGNSIITGTAVDGKNLIFGKYRIIDYRYASIVLYDFILYNRTLSEQEIQNEIKKYNL